MTCMRLHRVLQDSVSRCVTAPLAPLTDNLMRRQAHSWIVPAVAAPAIAMLASLVRSLAAGTRAKTPLRLSSDAAAPLRPSPTTSVSQGESLLRRVDEEGGWVT